MKTMNISDFKAKCIGVIKEAHRTGTHLIITRRGEPLVRIEPIPRGNEPRKLGLMRSSVEIKGDLVGLDFTDDWEIEES